MKKKATIKPGGELWWCLKRGGVLCPSFVGRTREEVERKFAFWWGRDNFDHDTDRAVVRIHVIEEGGTGRC